LERLGKLEINNMKINNPTIFGLAGLLHDIGKFGQRADITYTDATLLDTNTKNIIGSICKLTREGWYSHQHVLWTKAFIDKHIVKFNNAGLAENSDTYNNLVNLASYHHVPSTNEQGLITLADWWSSGIDRNTDEALEKNVSWGKDKFRSMPLASVFEKLDKWGQGDAKTKWVYPVNKFSTGESIFPKIVDEVDNKSHYRKLWDAFEADFEKLPDNNSASFIYSLYHLLKLYTWYMPGSAADYQYISLFEHLKTTGAFAHCFAAYIREQPDCYISDSNHRLTFKDDIYPVQLLCGDVSGIQSFIYSISNKSAVKSLKGRSLYVQLLAETVANELLEACGCSIINMIYAAGGKFYILLPNSEKINRQVVQYKQELENALWDEHKGKLSVNISSTAFVMRKSGRELKTFIKDESGEKHVGELWKNVSDKTGEAKKKKFKGILLNKFDKLFEASGMGGNVSICSVTGEEIKPIDDLKLTNDNIEQASNEVDENETLYISKNVKEQINLGKDLVGHYYLAEWHRKENGTIMIGTNTYWKLLPTFDEKQYKAQTWILTNWKDDINIIPESFVEKNSALGFRLYGGSEVATVLDEKSTKTRNQTFEELADAVAGDDKESFTRLGVLRMDIDGLGDLFMKGFDRKYEENNEKVNEKKASFSALATLSTQLDVFFSGYLNTIRNKPAYRDHVNIVYSGGDDLFAVGKWDKIIAFAEEVRAEFRRFVCGREDISISGGISLVRPKFPIAKAAELAGDAEGEAKNKIYEMEEKISLKNAISVFGVAMNWEKEWPFVKDCKNDLVRWIGEEKILSKGLLMKIFSWYEIAHPPEGSKQRPALDWKWQSAYSIARMANVNNNGPDTKKALHDIKNLLYCQQYGVHKNISFTTFIAACRWAELELRNLKTN
jgi:CRISPR-associated protein Csm1